MNNKDRNIRSFCGYISSLLIFLTSHLTGMEQPEKYAGNQQESYYTSLTELTINHLAKRSQKIVEAFFSSEELVENLFSTLSIKEEHQNTQAAPYAQIEKTIKILQTIEPFLNKFLSLSTLYIRLELSNLTCYPLESESQSDQTLIDTWNLLSTHRSNAHAEIEFIESHIESSKEIIEGMINNLSSLCSADDERIIKYFFYCSIIKHINEIYWKFLVTILDTLVAHDLTAAVNHTTHYLLTIQQLAKILQICFYNKLVGMIYYQTSSFLEYSKMINLTPFNNIKLWFHQLEQNLSTQEEDEKIKNIKEAASYLALLGTLLKYAYAPLNLNAEQAIPTPSMNQCVKDNMHALPASEVITFFYLETLTFRKAQCLTSSKNVHGYPTKQLPQRVLQHLNAHSKNLELKINNTHQKMNARSNPFLTYDSFNI